jgi:RHS repeat-associated protein
VDGYNFASLDYYDTSTTTALAPFRVFSPNIGRWHSPDPLGGDVTNPQSLNRYAYVMSNPTTNTDPTGLVTIHGPGNPPGGGGGGCDPDDPSCDPDPCDIDFVFGCPSGDGGGGGQTPQPSSSGGGTSQSTSFTLGPDCIPFPEVITDIQNDLLALFNRTFGTKLTYDPDNPNGISYRVVNGTETLSVNQPGGTPVTQIPANPGTPYDHPGFRLDIRPKDGVPSSPGDYGHVIWNPITPAPGIIANAEVHADWGTSSIHHPIDTVRHGVHWLTGPFLNLPQGCVQKFANFGTF